MTELSPAATALAEIESWVEQMDVFGWGDGHIEFPSNVEGAAGHLLYFIRARLTWEVAKEAYEGTYVSLGDTPDAEGFTAVDRVAFTDVLVDHPEWAMGINATIGKETLESILEKHPKRMANAKKLLDPKVLETACEKAGVTFDL